MNSAIQPIETPLRGFLREFAQDRVAVVAFAVLALIVLIVLLSQVPAARRLWQRVTGS